MRMFPRRPAGGFALPALLTLLVTASRLVAVDWTVDIIADEDDGSCSAGDCSLREALGAAGDGDTVYFALPGSPPWTILLQPALGPLSTGFDVTVDGPGLPQDLVISGGDALRLLTVPAGALVTLSELTLRDGRATSSGDKHGGCLKVQGEVHLSAVRFESCQAWSGGVTSNTEGGDGGAVFVAAGGVLVGDLVVLVDNAAGAGGGALLPPPSFRGGRGGAIANAGELALTRSTASGCTGGAGGGPVGAGGEGGAIANLAGGSLRLDASTLTGNRSGDGATFMGSSGADGRGGGIFCEADCTLNNVTLSGNAVGTTSVGLAAQGGGLAVTGGTTRLRNVTVSGNVANGTGGGIARVSGGTIATRHSLFAGNSGASSQHDCSTGVAGGVVGDGFNLIRVNNGCATSFSGSDLEGTAALPLEPLLDPLSANGGPTATHALQAASPAIDAGDPVAGCLAWDPASASDVAMPSDQRGEPRPTDGDGDAVADCDIGSYERAGVPPEEHLLTVALGGGGAGSVTSDPVGIACLPDCTQSYVFNLTVDLTPFPDANSYFAGWSGDCSGSGACSVPMSADRSVTASFELLRTLTVVVEGGTYGSVGSAPPGISCPGDCSEPYEQTVLVDLTAQPAAGAFFVGWSGDCSGSGACSLQMTIDRAVSATFLPFLVFADDFETGDYCAWSAVVGGDPCPPRARALTRSREAIPGPRAAAPARSARPASAGRSGDAGR